MYASYICVSAYQILCLAYFCHLYLKHTLHVFTHSFPPLSTPSTPAAPPTSPTVSTFEVGSFVLPPASCHDWPKSNRANQQGLTLPEL